MSYIYYPGCQYSQYSPETTEKIKQYLGNRFGMESTGCCRVNHARLNAGDTAVCVCPTCSFVLEESAPQAKVKSLWEVLAEDEQFPWPDYGNRPITVQDCMDMRGNEPLKQAVRDILKRMNLQVTELAMEQQAFDFCRPRTDEALEQTKVHCQNYETDMVVCYCTGCHKGLKAADIHGVHLLNLIMQTD